MTPQSFASCPLCSSVFEIDEQTPQIAIDGRLRFLCRSCRPIAAPPVAGKPNGPITHGEDRR